MVGLLLRRTAGADLPALLLFALVSGCTVATPAADALPPTAAPQDTVQAPPPSPAPPTQVDAWHAVREEILKMSREDAEQRAALADVLPGTPDFDVAIGRLAEGDRDRARRVGELITQRGLPLPDAVGEETTAALLSLVLRDAVPAGVQDGVLGALERAYREGRVGGNRLATFTDQLRMMRDQPQVYGTQLLLDLETGALRPYPIENEEAVDGRRRDLGLGPFGDYLRRMRARVEGA